MNIGPTFLCSGGHSICYSTPQFVGTADVRPAKARFPSGFKDEGYEPEGSKPASVCPVIATAERQ